MAELNGNQFSQPHLPGMHVKPTDQHRWPRGFTPERKAEVESVFPKNAHIVSNQTADLPAIGPFAGHYATADRPSAKGPVTHMGRVEGAAKINETIARSTIDLSDLGSKPPQIISTPGKDEFDKYGEYERGPSQYGGRDVVRIFSNPPGYAEFDRLPTKEQTSSSASKDQHQRQRAEHTLLHELGHHASNVAGNESAQYSTPALRGQEEAFADDFASRHFRPDPRDARRGPTRTENAGYDAGGRRPSDPRGSGYGSDDDDDFADSYVSHRQFPSKYVDRSGWKPKDGRVDQYPSGTPKYPGDPDIEGQGRLFARQGRDAKDTSLDYGQHPLVDSDKQPLPTHRLGRGAHFDMPEGVHVRPPR